MTSETDLLNQLKEEFLAERTRQEVQIAAWAEKLNKLDPTILQGVCLPKEISLRSIIPELYAAEPDSTIYESQYKMALNLFEQINQIADKYNEEAKKCLLEYQELSSKE